MHKLTFTLKQHTPLIHFQHDQDGATLRATEVKPKLDRFLIEKYQNFHPNLFKKTPEGDYFLSYKLSIICEENPVIDVIDKPFPCFFAAMGGEYKLNPKCFSYTDKPIIIKFICYENQILNLIKAEIAHFFAITNFGTRQSKGFGSFYIHVKDRQHYKEPSQFLSSAIYFPIRNTVHKETFTDIETIYKIMKSGFNFPDHREYYEGSQKRIDYNIRNHRGYAVYIKSFLMGYFLEQNIGNEKKFIKENFFSPQVRIPHDGVNKKYVRALLGTTDGIEFRGKDRKGKISIKSETVERYKSPVFFKVIEGKVFIFLTNQVLPESTFTFTFRGSEDSRILKTPSLQLFGSNFLKEFGAYFELEKTRVLEEIKTFSGTLPNVITQLKDSFDHINLVYK